jgi:hypothetical protein
VKGRDVKWGKNLLLMGLNIGLVASSIVSFWIRHSVPGVLAIACGAVGGVTIYSRFKLWKTGTTKHFYELVKDDEEATKKMKYFDTMFWATAAFNSIIFLWYLAK